MSAILFKISPSMRDFYFILTCTIAQNVVALRIPRSYSPFTTFRVTLTPRAKLIFTR